MVRDTQDASLRELLAAMARDAQQQDPALRSSAEDPLDHMHRSLSEPTGQRAGLLGSRTPAWRMSLDEQRQVGGFSVFLPSAFMFYFPLVMD